MLCVLLLCTVASFAEPVRVWSDDDLAHLSSAIIVGRVVDISAGHDGETGASYTYVSIAVDEAIKGDIPDREIVLKQLATSGQAQFERGERALLFLETEVRDRTLHTVALWQGKWTIDGSADQRWAARFDPVAASRGAFRGIGERRALTSFVALVRARVAGSPAALPRSFVAEPPADEMRGAVHLPAAASARVTANAGSAPAPPSLTSQVSGSTVTLSWSVSANATAYIIEAGSSPGAANLANFSTGSTSTVYLASGVGPGSYYVRVRAANADGVSAPSNEVVAIVGTTCVVPPAPTGLALNSVSGSTVVLSWNEVPLAYTYVIQAGSAPGSSNLVNADLGSNLPGLRATGVAAGTYYVRVLARTPCATSGPSNEILVPVGGVQGSLTITFLPDPARVEPPFSCSRIWGGPQWTSTTVVTNTGSVGITITAFKGIEIAEGHQITVFDGNGNNFAFWLPCDDPNAYFGAPRIGPGERRCLYHCYVLRGTVDPGGRVVSPGGTENWSINGVDDRGNGVSAAAVLRLPSWPASLPATQTLPAPSPITFESLRRR
jgi:hypothetical protein